MKEYSRARVYLDEDYKSQEHFTVSALCLGAGVAVREFHVTVGAPAGRPGLCWVWEQVGVSEQQSWAALGGCSRFRGLHLVESGISQLVRGRGLGSRHRRRGLSREGVPAVCPPVSLTQPCGSFP